MSTLRHSIVDRIRTRLSRLYGDQAADCLEKIERLLDQYQPLLVQDNRPAWDQRDIVLITYADQVQADNQPPLQTLREFLTSQGLDQLIKSVHLLPFYPYSSDDGFSVIDYRAVNPDYGSWDDIGSLGGSFDLMFDLVLNHTSVQSGWFQQFLRGQSPYSEYFIEVDPSTDLTGVTRPRSLPLLTRFETARGPQHVWTTFSPDQVDLNFENPDVLVEMLDVLLCYIQQDARIIRLDAVAYLWKRIGTACIHLPQTHEVIRLMRDVIDAIAPHVLLLTETNVPFEENISYFGAGNEAHMVYQFSLPPLILEALLSHDARALMRWLAQLPAPPPGTTYFNFTASHDGIGLRPLEGLLSASQMERLTKDARDRGGLVSTYQNSQGDDIPYEINISYASALSTPHVDDNRLHIRRMLASQGLMLALQGMPAIYFHSLVGTLNDSEAAASSGHRRDINRRKFRHDELESQLNDSDSMTARLFTAYRKMLEVRIRQPAFHPDAAQSVCQTAHPWLVALARTSLDQRHKILVLVNVGDQRQVLDLKTFTNFAVTRDLLSETTVREGVVGLAPYQIVWLI